MAQRARVPPAAATHVAKVVKAHRVSSSGQQYSSYSQVSPLSAISSVHASPLAGALKAQVTAGGHGAKSQRGGTRETELPSGHMKASSVHALSQSGDRLKRSHLPSRWHAPAMKGECEEEAGRERLG